jgi:hypothetical protein
MSQPIHVTTDHATDERAPRGTPAQTYGLTPEEQLAWQRVGEWLKRNPGRPAKDGVTATGVDPAVYRSAKRKAVACDRLAFGDMGFSTRDLIRPGDGILKREGER